MILDCGHQPTKTTGLGAGIAHLDDATACYDCASGHNLATMIEAGKGILYLSDFGIFDSGDVTLSDWPGVFKTRGGYKRSRRPVMSDRIDVWFTLDGSTWWGWGVAEKGRYIRVRRTKR